MERLRRIEMETEARERGFSDDEEEEDMEEEEEDSEPQVLLEFDEWAEKYGGPNMPPEIAELRYMDYAR